MRAILAVNAGSSSLKLSLFDSDDPGLRRIAHEKFEEIDRDEALRAKLLDGIGDWCRRHAGARQLIAAGHRVVHGGIARSQPVLVDDTVLSELESLVPLAPLHQPHSIAPIRHLQRTHRSLAQVACFDTAFHLGRPSAVQRYGLPDRLWRDGIRRYGFHGLSYEYVVGALRVVAPEVASKRLVIAHLGSGASLCAVHQGRSVDTTMGFSTLSGVVMGTRCGDLDPGVVLHLLRDGHRSIADVENLLYRESGLRGISGTTGQVRELLADGAAGAREAIDCFLVSIVREVGALVAMMGGVDALVFTAGIGEHSSEIRARVCRSASWTGLVLDEQANSRGGPCISAPRSKVSAWVIPTDEERMIALHTRAVLERAQD